MRQPSAQNTKSSGASPSQGEPGRSAQIAARFAGSATRMIVACCKSLFVGAESAVAQRSRTISSGTGAFR